MFVIPFLQLQFSHKCQMLMNVKACNSVTENTTCVVVETFIKRE